MISYILKGPGGGAGFTVNRGYLQFPEHLDGRNGHCPAATAVRPDCDWQRSSLTSLKI